MRRLLVLVCIASALPLCADFSYVETSRVTGGRMMKFMKAMPGGGKALEDNTSTVMVIGNRLANVHDKHISVIDLDKETMTEIDLQEKTYAVITFADFKAALEAMRKKLAQQTGQTDLGADFKVDVKETGQTKTVASLAAKEFIVDLTMSFQDKKSGQKIDTKTNMDMWMAGGVPGYEEIRQFYKRMGEKLAWSPQSMRMGPMAAMQPGMNESMAKLASEMSKLEGIPVQQIVKMYGGAGLGAMPDMSGSPDMSNVGQATGDAATNAAASQAQREAYSEAARAGGRTGSVTGAAAGAMVGSMLGGFKKKKPAPQEQPKPEAAPKPAAAPGSDTLIEITTEMSYFGSNADAGKFAVPAGFKEVEHSMKKGLKEMK